jgi:D-3-phosphoglycerate dehydrogenase
LAPFHSSSLVRLRQRIDVIHESWMETRQLLSPEALIERIERQNLSIVVIEADFLFEEVFEAADKLCFVGVCRAGLNQVDIDAATRHGVLVVNTPGRNAVSVAELAVGLMLSLARRIPGAHYLVHSGQWLDPVGPYTSLRGLELAGKTAGIIGFGAIGAEVTKRLLAFDMKVLTCDPYVSPEKVAQAGAKPVTLPELMPESDFIVIGCPATRETVGLIGEEMIRLMRPTAYLINPAAWEVVDEPALLHALETRRIAGAAFDTYATHPVPNRSPLLKLTNVVLTPHIGGATDGTIARYSQMMTDDIERFLEGERPLNLVNAEAWRQNA